MFWVCVLCTQHITRATSPVKDPQPRSVTRLTFVLGPFGQSVAAFTSVLGCVLPTLANHQGDPPGGGPRPRSVTAPMSYWTASTNRSLQSFRFWVDSSSGSGAIPEVPSKIQSVTGAIPDFPFHAPIGHLGDLGPSALVQLHPRPSNLPSVT